MPNRDILQRHFAEHLLDCREGDVIAAPPIEMFSAWVEDMAVRIRQLSGREVPRSQDAISGLLDWHQPDVQNPSGPGHAFAWSVARQARSADRLLRQWQEGDDPHWVDGGFYALRQKVRASMAASRTWSGEDWLEDLANALSKSDECPVKLPEAIELSGFVEMTPLETRLLDVLEARGVGVTRVASAGPRSDRELVGFDAPQDEWNAAARWARDLVDSGARAVCVVLPARVTAAGAASRGLRQAFARTFAQAATPDMGAGQAGGPSDDEACPFYIPAGMRLSHCRSVLDAFMLMRLALHGGDASQSFATISQWLLSPHWAGDDAERIARARLELRLRERGLFRLSLQEVERLARAERLADSLPALTQGVAGLGTVFSGAGRKGAVRSGPAHPDDSAGAKLHAALRHWGWPGPHGGRALGMQCQKLHGLLERLDGVTQLSADDALGLLPTLCEDTVLPYGGGPLSPVQVLSPEVAAGGRFDATWLCHADDVNWPPPTAANPFLPPAARGAIPRMNPEGQYAYYRALTRMLCEKAPSVRASWSRDAGHGPRNPSGLVADWPAAERQSGASAIQPGAPESLSVEALSVEALSVEALSVEALSVEAIADGAGIAYAGEGQVVLPGGAEFFRLQAACPLAAYTRFRLGARFPAMPSPLADPAFRGVLLHRALRNLYAPDQDPLVGDPLAGNPPAGDARGIPDASRVPGAVAATLADRQVRARLTATGLRAEAGRLERALRSWLSLDASREGFTVEALEEPRELRLGRALVRTRFDRLDRLADGRAFLIDYKSSNAGNSRALKWLLPRIQELQLPLYAVLHSAAGHGAVGGLAIAAVRPGDCEFDGLTADEGSAARGIRVVGKGSGAVKSWGWDKLITHWQAQAALLCEEILAGRADNKVYDADALRYGDLSLILRQDEKIPEDGETDAD